MAAALCYVLTVAAACAQTISSVPVQPGTGLALSGGAMNLQPAGPSTIGGVNSLACATHTWLNTISTLGVPTCAQPAVGDISGWGTNVAAALGNPLNGAGGMVGYSSLGSGVATALGNTAGGTGGFALNSQLASYLALAGGTMSGNIAMGGFNVSGVGAITATTYNGLPVGTNAAEGILQCDGSTTTCSGGRVTAVGAASTTIAPLTTGVTGGTNGDFLGVTTSGCGSGSPCLSQVAMTAPLVGYTPPGTGGVATTVQAELQRSGLWANDYGAVCNGSTDDHVAFQNAINEAEILGVEVRFIGDCAITTGLSITAGITFSGVNWIQSLLLPSAGINAITITIDKSVFLHDFGIDYLSSSGGETGLTVTAAAGVENANSRFSRLEIIGPHNAVDFVQANGWSFTDSVVAGIPAGGIGINIQDTVHPDNGSNVLCGNNIIGSGNVAIYWQSSATRICNNTFSGAYWNVGIEIALASGAMTGDLQILSNNIEGYSQYAIYLLRQGTTGVLNNSVISSNEMGGGLSCVNEATDATGSWITGLAIGNNVCETTSSAGTNIQYNFGTAVNGLSIVGGTSYTASGVTSIPVSLATQTATNCVVGPLAKVGTFSASGLSACTSYPPN